MSYQDERPYVIYNTNPNPKICQPPQFWGQFGWGSLQLATVYFEMFEAAEILEANQDAVAIPIPDTIGALSGDGQAPNDFTLENNSVWIEATFYFHITLSGRGLNADDAWLDACEQFGLDPGPCPSDDEYTREYDE